jgi:serine protease Do
VAQGDDRAALEAIRARAAELTASDEQVMLHSADAEVLAAIVDGTLSIDAIDDATLERLVQALGIDSVMGALMSTSRQSAEATYPAPLMVQRRAAAQGKRMRPWWRLRTVSLGAGAAIAVAATIGFLMILPVTRPLDPQSAAVSLVPQWPSQPPFDPGGLRTWESPQPGLPTAMPAFDKTTGTLGASGDERVARWRLATVIVRSENGWGSGAFISADGWVVTNYHVVARAAQKAAVSGKPARLDVIMATIAEGRTKPQAPVQATLYRANPVHDLALLKVDALPADRTQVPFFTLGNKVETGQDCFVIGSQNNGPAWWVRGATVSQQFDFPTDLSQFAAGVASVGSSMTRTRSTVTVTDARVSGGDSGGPLLNSKGELIGVTFATSANTSAGSVGWHIGLQHVKAFTSDLPSQPEGVPFDVWTAGLPDASVLEPELVDGDHDGRVDSLRYRYVTRSQETSGGGTSQPAGITVFVDLGQRGASSRDHLDRVPLGLWGMESRGRFRFDLFVTSRADGVTAVGYAGPDGVVDEVRLGRSGQPEAAVVWRRESKGTWRAMTPPAPMSLVDTARVGPGNMSRLQAVTGQIVAPGERRSPEKQDPREPRDSDRRGPNKM